MSRRFGCFKRYPKIGYSSSPRSPHHHFLTPLVLYDHVRGEDAAPVGVGIDHGAASDDAARVQNGIATDIRVVTQQGAEFSQARIKWHAVLLHHHIAGEHLDVRNLHPRAEMRLVAENG